MNSIKHFVPVGKAKPVEWLGYLAALLICIIHLVPMAMVLKTIGILLPIAMLVLFAHVIATNGKTTIQDIAITFFGIFYVVVFLLFIPVIREDLKEGKILIWFVFFSAWGTDIFAYLIGRHFGKHHFTEISPNKTIEGCIGGTIGGVLTVVIYGLVCNFVFHTQMNYILLVLVGILLSLSGQLGDLAASAVKRYTEIKDFSNLIPGHGGMMDRIDSIIFIAPFAYFLLPMLIR